MSSASVRCEFLQTCARRFAEADERFEALVGPLDAERANWKPAPDRWSVAQCVEHLNLGAQAYFGPMEDAVRRAREKGWTGVAPFRRGPLAGRLLVRFVNPDSRRKVKAPGFIRPAASGLDFPRVCEGFRAVSRRFAELMESADGLDLGRVRFTSPLSRLVSVSLAQAFELHSLHELRHLAQAERVTRSDGFPEM